MQHTVLRDLEMTVAPPRRSSTIRSPTMRSPTMRVFPSPTSTELAPPSAEVANPSGRILNERFVDGSSIDAEGGRDPQRSSTQYSDQTVVDPERTIESIQAFAPSDTRRYDKRQKSVFLSLLIGTGAQHTVSLVHLSHGLIQPSVMMKAMKCVSVNNLPAFD